MSASGYFIAAAVVLLLGMIALPSAATAYAVASAQDPMSVVAGVWAGFVIVIAIAGPIVLTAAGIVALARRRQ